MHDSAMSRVVLVTTGGTIASVADETGVLLPARSGAELLGADGQDIEVVDVLAKDSSQLTLDDWDRIASAISSAVDDGADGVVVTHGTDTLEETALWLDLTYGGSAPVVLTGAAKSADAPDADGPGNLRDSVELARTVEARDLGVAICLARTVFAPLGTTKTGDGPRAGFDGPAIGGIVNGHPRIHTPKQRMFLGAASATSAPRVDVIACYLGGDAVALDACVAAGARGVVLETVGSGNAGDAIVDAVRRHCDAGIVVAVSTRVPFGGVRARYGPGAQLVAAGAVEVRRLRPPQARVLVMAALATGSPVGDVFARWG
jgi:L-asparaginase